MLQKLLGNKKASALILIGVAAYAYYRYSKMSEKEKDELVETVTKTGKNLLGQFMDAKNNVAEAADNLSGEVVG